MEPIYFELTDGELEIGISVTEMADGSLKFDVAVLAETGVIGDLNGLFFDVADDNMVENLVVSGADLTGEVLDANSVTKIDGYNNLNGEVVKEVGKFDVGVQFGTQGMAKDDIQETTFTLSTNDGSWLSISDVLNQDFAVRLTSVGSVDGSRGDSAKISGTSEPIVVEPPVEPGPENIAAADSMTVSNRATFSDFGVPDILDGFQFTLLNNDTTDDAPYSGAVVAANGFELEEGLILQGSDGGLLIVYPDGTVDFSANDEFGFLTSQETATTQFDYTIEGGSKATLDVLVFANDETGGGGGMVF